MSRRKPFVVSLSNHKQPLDPSTGSEPAPYFIRGRTEGLYDTLLEGV